MNNHKNARLTVHSRVLIAKRVLYEGWSAKAAASAFGVSRRTVYKWLARWREGGGPPSAPPQLQSPRVCWDHMLIEAAKHCRVRWALGPWSPESGARKGKNLSL